MSHVRTTVRPVLTMKRAAACLLVLVLALPAACAGRKPPKQAQGPAFTVSSEHVQLLRRHRPDLAERWTTPVPEEVPFEPLDINTVAGHEKSLRGLLDRARALPASVEVDSLRARLTFELEQTAPGGALRTDPLLWLAIVEAAAREPFAYDSTAGCREVERAMRQFDRIPEALRGAAVLMSGTPPPDPVAFEAALTRVEWVFRHDLPHRTKACKEGRLLADFVEADTLAAASLAGFRRLLVSGP
jgi:hypothetical protein